MRAKDRSNGFTVIEVVVTLTIMGLFLALFFQIFSTSQQQELSTLRLAAANDLAQTNLRKITKKNQISPAAAACSASNDLTQDANAAGSDITFTAETTLPPSLPSSTQQQMKVQYPQGCDISMPAKIISIVTYTAGASLEEIRRVSYVSISL